jgi:hypothetical protein
MNPGLFHWQEVLCAPLPFTVWGVPSCIPVGSALHTPVLQDTPSVGPEEDISGLHLQHGVWMETSHPPFLMGGILDLHHLCPLPTPSFHLLGILVGSHLIQNRIYWGGAYHMGFGWRPHALL